MRVTILRFQSEAPLFSFCCFSSGFSQQFLLCPQETALLISLSQNKNGGHHWSRNQTNRLKNELVKSFFVLFRTSGLKNRENNYVGEFNADVQKVRVVERSCVSRRFLARCYLSVWKTPNFHTQFLPTSSLWSSLSSLFFLSLVPLFFYSSLGFKWMPSPSLISTLDSCLQLQKNV